MSFYSILFILYYFIHFIAFYIIFYHFYHFYHFLSFSIILYHLYRFIRNDMDVEPLRGAYKLINYFQEIEKVSVRCAQWPS